MTADQELLLITIVSRLDTDAVTGEWPHQECRYCNGKSDGYYDSRSFTHAPECIVPLIRQLRGTTYTSTQTI